MNIFISIMIIIGKSGESKFDVVDADKVELLEQGDTYRVYFLGLAKQILSLEKITKEKKV